MNKAVTYARVSSKEQEAEGYSIPAQVKLLHEYATNSQLLIVKEFVDVETAKKAGRTNFNEMKKYLHENKGVKNLLVEKVDRLLRNLFDLAFTDQLMTEFNVKVHFVKEGFVIDKYSRSSDKFLFALKGIMAKQSVDNLSEEVIKGMKEKAEQGVFPSHAPYGYKNEGTKGKRIISKNPEEALYVKKIYDLYCEGYSLARIRSKVLSEGLVYRNGKNFHKSTVEYILKNEFYTGVFYWNGVRYENASHPIIISKEQFNEVQGKLMKPNKQKSHKGIFPYTGLIKCGLCGCYLTAEIKKGKYIYYHCTGSKGKCPQIYLKQEFIEAEIQEMLDGIRLSDEAHQIISQGLRENIKEKIEYHNQQVKQIEAQIEVLQSRLDKAYTDKIDGKISEDFWNKNARVWAEEKERLAMSLVTQQRTDTHFLDTVNLILELSKQATGLFKRQNADERRKLIQLITSNCVLRDEKLHWELAEPFDKFMETKKSGNWCA